MARRIPFLLSVISTALIFFPGPVRSADLPIPEVDRWHSQMVTRGATICSRLAQNGGLGDTYYDMTAVMYQIADYTGDPSWTDCALRARGIYRDSYVIPNTGRVPGYWNFPTGLRMDFQRTADALSQQAVALLAQNAAYASDFAPLPWSETADRSREVAYAILSYISAEALGLSPGNAGWPWSTRRTATWTSGSCSSRGRGPPRRWPSSLRSWSASPRRA